ncbi:MAG: Sir2 silent information regulator family NAD-dependent deacetylase [Oscillospiraceae bacterium]|nr:Sir2 silent information regulator family NAD-dependent deacetylase [Oscillospiraceae bacterium]
MFSRTRTGTSTAGSWARTGLLRRAVEEADAVLVGAGAGLSASAGFTYSGARFERYFADFRARYGFQDMYSGGFYPFETPEERWAYWSRYIFINRYEPPPRPVYDRLRELVGDRDYFVLTTNVDHCFQRAGFDKRRLFYTQGDYGLWQCSLPCHRETYDNEAAVRRMWAEQRDMRVPPELVPRCPRCGRPMAMNLRADHTFVQDRGWYAAARRYEEFTQRHSGGAVLYLELGVGLNTPGIIKYNFWRRVLQNPRARYLCVGRDPVPVPREIQGRSLCLDADIGEALAG